MAIKMQSCTELILWSELVSIRYLKSLQKPLDVHLSLPNIPHKANSPSCSHC